MAKIEINQHKKVSKCKINLVFLCTFVAIKGTIEKLKQKNGKKIMNTAGFGRFCDG